MEYMAGGTLADLLQKSPGRWFDYSFTCFFSHICFVFSNDLPWASFLQDHILSETQAKKILCPIMEALHYMHGQMIAHRDIKTENIFLGSQSQIKVGAVDVRYKSQETARFVIECFFSFFSSARRFWLCDVSDRISNRGHGVWLAAILCSGNIPPTQIRLEGGTALLLEHWPTDTLAAFSNHR